MQASGLDLEQHYSSLANYLEVRLQLTTTPTSLASPFPLNARLRFPFLLSKALSLKSGLRYRLHLAYIKMDWDELKELGGPDSESRLSLLRWTVKQLVNYHRQMWMATYEVRLTSVLAVRSVQLT